MKVEVIKQLESVCSCDFHIYKNGKHIYPKGNPPSDDIEYFETYSQNGYRVLTSRQLQSVETSLVEIVFKNFSANYYSLLIKEDAYLEFMDELVLPYRMLFIKQSKENYESTKDIVENYISDSITISDNTRFLIVLVKSENLLEVNFEDLIGEIETEILENIQILVSEEIISYRSFYKTFTSMMDNFDLFFSYNQKLKLLELEKLLLTQLVINSPKSLLEEKRTIDFTQMDEELTYSALEFLRNDLNVTQTADKLYVHRNTLIYRLTKIEQITGYDIRKFNDAVNFYIVYLSKKMLEIS